MSKGPSKKKLRKFVRKTQEWAWDDLDRSIERSLNGVWSIGCEGDALTIIEAARLVGPTPWRKVSWDLVRGGVYHALLAAPGVDTPPVLSAEEVWETEELMARHNQLGAGPRRYAPTVAAVEKFLAESTEV